METLQLLLIGVLTGVVAPLIGIGGGIIVTPLLSIALGFPLQTAVGISSVSILTNSLAASRNNLASGQLDPLFTVKIAVLAALAGFLGGYLGVSISSSWLSLFFSITLFLLMFILLLERILPAFSRSKKSTQKKETSFFLIGVLVFFAAFLGGMVGISGGSMIVPILFFLSPLTWKQSVASSSFLTGYLTLPAVITRLSLGHIPLALSLALLLGIRLGAMLGKPLFNLAPPFLLRILFVVCISTSAFSMLYTSLQELL